ncbi:MAG TPA: hypothetical protein VH352_24910 [Pseudonocardiaceae bacterium]|nr:hypothetical protein [Pseudonocardiaceae bacterium]
MPPLLTPVAGHGEQHRHGADHGAVLGRAVGEHLGQPPYADPRAGEQVPLLPSEHLRRRVRPRGQHPRLAERPDHAVQFVE